MTSYVALLRAVNVGGTGKLAMADLRRLCEIAGFAEVETYIASGNVVFHSAQTAAKVKARLEQALVAHSGKVIGVLVRTGLEMAVIAERNPFPDVPASRVAVHFLDAPPADDIATTASGRRDEVIIAGEREIYVCYPTGMGTSKLKLRGTSTGTTRNMNTVAKLAQMSAKA